MLIQAREWRLYLLDEEVASDRRWILIRQVYLHLQH